MLSELEIQKLKEREKVSKDKSPFDVTKEELLKIDNYLKILEQSQILSIKNQSHQNDIYNILEKFFMINDYLDKNKDIIIDQNDFWNDLKNKSLPIFSFVKRITKFKEEEKRNQNINDVVECLNELNNYLNKYFIGENLNEQVLRKSLTIRSFNK